MSIRAEFVCKFGDIKSSYRDTQKLDILMSRDSVTLFGLRSNTYTVQMFRSEVYRDAEHEDMDVVGVSLAPDMLFQLPSRKDSHDVVTVDIIADRVTITVNGLPITVSNNIFDKMQIDRILQADKEGTSISFREVQWLAEVSRFYKDVVTHFTEDYAYTNTPDGLFVQELVEEKFPGKFAVPALFVYKSFRNKVKSVKLGDVLVTECQDSRLILSEYYKVETRFISDFVFARKQKFKCKVELNLFEFRDLFKLIKKGNVTLNLGTKTISIVSPKNEMIEVPLGDNCNIHTTGIADFQKFIEFNQVLETVTISSPTILKFIAAQRYGITIYLGVFAHVFDFGRKNYLLCQAVNAIQ